MSMLVLETHNYKNVKEKIYCLRLMPSWTSLNMVGKFMLSSVMTSRVLESPHVDLKKVTPGLSKKASHKVIKNKTLATQAVN